MYTDTISTSNDGASQKITELTGSQPPEELPLGQAAVSNAGGQ